MATAHAASPASAATKPASETAAQAATAGAPKVGQTFGNWIFQCSAVAQNNTICTLSQTLVDGQSKKPIAKFSVGRSGPGSETRLVVLLPLGLDIASGVSGSVDKGAEFKYTLESCVPSGCIASRPVDAALLNGIRTGTALNVSFRFQGNDKAITLSGVLKSLGDGMTAAGF